MISLTFINPDEKYGYISINSLSKDLFNIIYKKNYYYILSKFNGSW